MKEEQTSKETLALFIAQADKANERTERLIREQAERDANRDVRQDRTNRILIAGLLTSLTLLVLALAGAVGVYFTLPDGTTTAAPVATPRAR